MKRILILLSLLALSFGTYAADSMDQDKSDGCGPGWNLYNKKTILGTSIRGTTNAVLPLQSSGMTSGTSNCAKHDIVLKEKEQQYFTERNYETLVAEMAIGQGEFLNEYAGLFGCESAKFGKMAQENFVKIVPANDNASQLLRNVKEEIKAGQFSCASV